MAKDSSILLPTRSPRFVSFSPELLVVAPDLTPPFFPDAIAACTLETSPRAFQVLTKLEEDIVGITICWNLLFIRAFLYPFKSLVVAYHEFG